MGQEESAPLNPTALKSALRQAKARIGIRRGQKINAIAKKKKELKDHLESGNEGMALIHVEPLIYDERMIPCYDVLAMYCDQVLERMPLLMKMGRQVPPDMYVALHTLVYSADKAGIDELSMIGGQIRNLYGKEFVKQGDGDPKAINDIIHDNINLTMLDEGLKVSRLIQLARDEGLHYAPTERSLASYKKYNDAKAFAERGYPGPGAPPAPGVPAPSGYPPYPMAQPPMMQQPIVMGAYSYPPPAAPQPQPGFYNPGPAAYGYPPAAPQYPPPAPQPQYPPVEPAPAPQYPPASSPPPAPQYPTCGPNGGYPSISPPPAGMYPPVSAPQQYPGMGTAPPTGPAPQMPPMAPMPPVVPMPPTAKRDNNELDDFEARLANLKKL